MARDYVLFEVALALIGLSCLLSATGANAQALTLPALQAQRCAPWTKTPSGGTAIPAVPQLRSPVAPAAPATPQLRLPVAPTVPGPIAKTGNQVLTHPTTPPLNIPGTFPTCPNPGSIAFDGAHIWVGCWGQVAELDAHTGNSLGNLDTHMGAFTTAMAFDAAHRIWIAGGAGGVAAFDQCTYQQVATDAVGTGPVGSGGATGIAFDGTHMWVVTADTRLIEFDVLTGHILGTLPLYTTYGPAQVAFDGKHLWVSSTDGGVDQLDPASRNQFVPPGLSRISHTSLFDSNGNNFHPGGVAFDGSHIWVPNSQTAGSGWSPNSTYVPAGTRVAELDLGGRILGYFPVGLSPTGLAFDGTHAWVVNSASNSVTKLDARTGAVLATVPVGNQPKGIVFDGQYIWVTNYGGNTVQRF
jgi:YVTN family beta-propeller protein